MSKRFSSLTHGLSMFLIVSIVSTGLLPNLVAAKEKRKPVIVSFGQPNIWTLEQAHYLLARMHMTNLDLQAKALTDGDLDPNRVEGTRIQILKQLLEVGAQFDQGIGFQNQRIVESARFNDERRRNLTLSRDRLHDQSLQLEREKNQLTRERAAIKDENSDKAKELDAAITQTTRDQAAVDKEITFQDSELQRLGGDPNGTLASPTPSASPFDKTRLPSGLLEKLTEDEIKNLFGGNRDPKLNATTMLDNTVQLQYEIIAKQLTLLRDEVGPGERLVFLELPQSIYTTPGDGDEKMAQSWWHVNGYTRTDPLLRLLLELYELEWKWTKIKAVPGLKKPAELLAEWNCESDLNAIDGYFEKKGSKDLASFGKLYQGFKCEHESARTRVLTNIYREASSSFDRVEQNGPRDISDVIEGIRKLISVNSTAKQEEKSSDKTAIEVQTRVAGHTRQELVYLQQKLLEILSEANPKITEGEDHKPSYKVDDGIEFIPFDEKVGGASPVRDVQRRIVRTVDIIPRQSSLNVNDIQETVKATGILAAFKFLFGFAGQVNFQRQKEQFEQFLHQELYASGFGKGNRDFGWTFGSLPGTNRVAPGVRTTYAALTVPDDAESIVLSARGCYFPRKSYQPLNFNDTGHSDWNNPNKFGDYSCGGEETYIVPIPGGGRTADFWVTNIDYQGEHDPGEFATVSVRGNNFSSQMGVLVNGIALLPTVGLAQPLLIPKKAASNGATPQAMISDCTGVTGICGRYERIDSQQIVFSFKMPDVFKGIPIITLIAPGKSVDLNSIPTVRINRDVNVNLRDDGPFMYGVRPPKVSIAEVQILNAASTTGSVDAIVTGNSFEQTDHVYVNGVEIPAAQKDLKSKSMYKLSFQLPSVDNLEFKIVQTKGVATKVIPTPAVLTITSATVIGYDPPVEKKSPGVLTVRLAVGSPSARLMLEKVYGASEPLSTLLAGASSGEAIVRLINPDPTVVITIRDVATGRRASTALQRPAKAEANGN